MNINELNKILLSCGVSNDNIVRFSTHIINGFNQYGITDKTAQCAFIANALHESSNFKSLSENLNYSVTGLLATFGNRITKEQADKWGYKKDNKGNVIQSSNKEAIANAVYGNRYGNSATEGYFFRGRGIFQLTFRQNYKAFKDDYGIDVVSNPDLLLQPEYAVKSAMWFYTKNKIHLMKDIKEIRKKINGGLNGYEEVKSLYEKIINI